MCAAIATYSGPGLEALVHVASAPEVSSAVAAKAAAQGAAAVQATGSAGANGGAVAVARPAAGKPYGIHTVCTSNGSPYLNWQTRIMYKTYQKARGREPAGALGATRAAKGHAVADLP